MKAMRLAVLAALPILPVSCALIDTLRAELNDISRDSLRAALRKTLSPQYQDGIFEHDQEAVEVLHSSNPALASQVVDNAKQEHVQKPELVRRQNVTVTTVTDTSPTIVTVVTSTIATVDSSSPGPTFTTVTPTVVDPPPPASTSTSTNTQVPQSTPAIESSATTLLVPSISTVTNNAPTTQAPPPQTTAVPQTSGGNGVTTAISTNVGITSASVSAVIPITTTNAQGFVITTSSTVPGVVVSSTGADGVVRVTTSPINNILVSQSGTLITSAIRTTASAQLRTTTDANGNIVVITVTPGSGEASELYLLTTTDPDGQRRTITSYKLVGGPTTSPGSPVSSTSPSATLATGAASPNAQVYTSGLLGLILAAFGAAAAAL